jgi:hypothetical protein
MGGANTTTELLEISEDIAKSNGVVTICSTPCLE